MNYPEFQDQVFFITGGGNGLGRATAIAFATQGARVALTDIDGNAGEETASHLRSLGKDAIFIKTDVRNEAEVKAAVGTVSQRFRRIDGLINSAGVSQKRTSLTEIDDAEYLRVMDINLKGSWLTMKYCIPQMLENGGGSIVNISSAMGLVAQPGVSIYAASKHAVIGLTKAAAIEFGRRNIRVNVICPGRHDTPMIAGWKDQTLSPAEYQAQVERNHPATGRVGKPEEIAAAALFLCSAGASNIHGVALPVDGGWTAQ